MKICIVTYLTINLAGETAADPTTYFGIGEIQALGRGGRFGNISKEHKAAGNPLPAALADIKAKSLAQDAERRYTQAGSRARETLEDAVATARHGVEDARSKADILVQNRAQGKAYEQERFSEFSQSITQAQEQITVKTQSSVRTRLDAIGYDAEGKIVINEFKSSVLAPLTKNQIIAFPEILNSGAKVVGRGKGIFTGGYSIPPGTVVIIIRPPKYRREPISCQLLIQIK